MNQSILKRLKILESKGTLESGVEVWEPSTDGSYILSDSDVSISAAALQNRIEKYPGIIMIIDDV